MRILKVQVVKWRNFRNVEISIPEDATLVCLVGENGTGKSNILELISVAANRIGISPGIDNPRGDPFSEEHDVSLDVRLDSALFERLPPDFVESCKANGVLWNGVISLSSRRAVNGHHQVTKIAGGDGDPNQRLKLAEQLSAVLQQTKETNYLSLDADRSYPPMQIQPHLYAQALERDWETPEWRKNRAFAPTRAMYDEWLQYFLAKESQ